MMIFSKRNKNKTEKFPFFKVVSLRLRGSVEAVDASDRFVARVGCNWLHPARRFARFRRLYRWTQSVGSQLGKTKKVSLW